MNRTTLTELRCDICDRTEQFPASRVLSQHSEGGEWNQIPVAIDRKAGKFMLCPVDQDHPYTRVTACPSCQRLLMAGVDTVITYIKRTAVPADRNESRVAKAVEIVLHGETDKGSSITSQRNAVR